MKPIWTALMLSSILATAGLAGPGELAVTVAPAAPGRQLVRLALPLPPGSLPEGQALVFSGGGREVEAGVRVLTWHGGNGDAPRSARRALATFPWTFPDNKTPCAFTFKAASPSAQPAAALPAIFRIDGEEIHFSLPGCRPMPRRRSRSGGSRSTPWRTIRRCSSSAPPGIFPASWIKGREAGR
ncbi:MAG: hypothetical protein HY717_10140 [Planctomycetes bacterium]|nr:hypothetical protein [Planctomycetota bacterium]